MHDTIILDRLTLRPLETTDTDDFARLVNDPDICRMTGSFPYPFDAMSVAGRVDIFLARAATGHSLHWAILEDCVFAGVIGVYRKEDSASGEKMWDLGYWLGRPFWGRRLASEAVVGLVTHLRAQSEALRMSACVFTDNPASARVLEKAGFERDSEPCRGYSLARRAHIENWAFSLNDTNDDKQAAGQADRPAKARLELCAS